MKKLFMSALILILALSMASCGGGDAEAPAEDTQTEAAEPAEPAVLAEDASAISDFDFSGDYYQSKWGIDYDKAVEMHDSGDTADYQVITINPDQKTAVRYVEDEFTVDIDRENSKLTLTNDNGTADEFEIVYSEECKDFMIKDGNYFFTKESMKKSL